MFSNATNVLCCRHSSRCSFADRVCNLEIEAHETWRQGGVRGGCQVPRVCTDYSPASFATLWLTGGGWPLLECPTERKVKYWPITLHFMPKLWAYWEKKQTGLWKPSGARHGAPIWKLQAWGILKCTPAVDICHLAPGIITVGIWGWQQGWSSFIDDEEGGRIFLPSDPSNKHVDHCCSCAWLPDKLSITLENIIKRQFPVKLHRYVGLDVTMLKHSRKNNPNIPVR